MNNDKDLRIDLMREIKLLMLDTLTKEQMQKLDFILLKCLDKYDVEVKETGIIEYNDCNDRLMDMYFGILDLEDKSAKTIAQYKLATKNMLEHIGKPCISITYYDVLEYFTMIDKKVSPVTYNNYVTYINQFFHWCHEEGFIKINPISKIGKKRVAKKIKEKLSTAERDCIRDNAKTLRDKALCQFLYSTACRIEEAVALNKSDIVGNEVRLYRYKNKTEGYVYLDSSAMYYLQKYLESRTDDDESLFVTLRKKPNTGSVSRLTTGAVQCMFRKLSKMCNIKVTPHKYRRSKSTDLLNAGMPIHEVQLMLGHKSPETTMEYYCQNQSLIKSDFMRYSA